MPGSYQTPQESLRVLNEKHTALMEETAPYKTLLMRYKSELVEATTQAKHNVASIHGKWQMELESKENVLRMMRTLDSQYLEAARDSADKSRQIQALNDQVVEMQYETKHLKSLLDAEAVVKSDLQGALKRRIRKPERPDRQMGLESVVKSALSLNDAKDATACETPTSLPPVSPRKVMNIDPSPKSTADARRLPPVSKPATGEGPQSP